MRSIKPGTQKALSKCMKSKKLKYDTGSKTAGVKPLTSGRVVSIMKLM